MKRKHNKTNVIDVLNSLRLSLYTTSSLSFSCLKPFMLTKNATNWQILWACLVIVRYCMCLIHFYEKFWPFYFCQISRHFMNSFCSSKLIYSFQHLYFCVYAYPFTNLFFHFSNCPPQDTTMGTPLVNSSRIRPGVWEVCDLLLAVHHAGLQAEPRRFCPWCWHHADIQMCVAQARHLRLPPALHWVVCDRVIRHLDEPVPGAAEDLLTSAVHQCYCSGQVRVPCDCWARSQHKSPAHTVCHGISPFHELFPRAADRLPGKQERYPRGPAGWRGRQCDHLHLRICDPQNPCQGVGLSVGASGSAGEQKTRSWCTIGLDIQQRPQWTPLTIQRLLSIYGGVLADAAWVVWLTWSILVLTHCYTTN